MKKLRTKGLKILKLLHMLVIIGWFGGGMAINLLVFQCRHSDNAQALSATLRCMEVIDMQLVANCALVTLIIGLLYGIFTHWGFFKHPWITCKWIITVTVIASGVILSSSYLDQMQAMVEQFGAAALNAPEFLFLWQANLGVGSVQLALLAIAVILSIWKPGRKKARQVKTA